MKNYEIIDNFLLENDFLPIYQHIVNSANISWIFQASTNNVVTDSNSNNLQDYYFTHKIFEHGPTSNVIDLLYPLLNKLKVKACIRIKANCYPSTQQLVIHPMHKDYPYSHQAAIFYLNDNDGFTILDDGSYIESKKNRILLFDGGTLHRSTNCTNQKARFNININYF